MPICRRAACTCSVDVYKRQAVHTRRCGHQGSIGADMAITKIHPIKSTLKKALDYIENPAKTDEKMLVSSFACSYETADIEFELLLSQAMQKGNNLAHHLIQSFAPEMCIRDSSYHVKYFSERDFKTVGDNC